MKSRPSSISLTLFQTLIEYLQKNYTLVEHGYEFLVSIISYYFLPFQTQETIYEKERLEFSFSSLFQTL